MRSLFLIIILGISFILSGFIFWIYKGFKTSLESELSNKFIKRNLILGLTLLLVYYLVNLVLIKSTIHEPIQPIEFKAIHHSEGYNLINEKGDTLFNIKE